VGARARVTLRAVNGPRSARTGADRSIALRREWPQRLTILGSVALIGTCLFMASTIASMYASVGKIDRIAISPDVLDTRSTDDPGGPRKILLIGTTENDGIDGNDDLVVNRSNTRLADTIMLLRLEPSTGQAAVLSINRDLWVHHDSYEGRINGAMQTGGVESLVRIVQGYIGVPVNDFAVVNFAGFRKIVDELDGVPVYFEHPAKDADSFFETSAGCHVLDGADALNYVRSRKYVEYVGGVARADNGDDQRRAERQAGCAPVRGGRGAAHPRHLRGLGNTLRPDQVTVQKVYDARGAGNEPVKPDALLRKLGFNVASAVRPAGGEARQRTTIRYSPDQRNAALLPARSLDAIPDVIADVGLKNLELTIGTDWTGVRAEPRPESDFAGIVTGVAPTTTAVQPTAPTATATLDAAPTRHRLRLIVRYETTATAGRCHIRTLMTRIHMDHSKNPMSPKR
jgi:LCP family protein required for cell wall assembly